MLRVCSKLKTDVRQSNTMKLHVLFFLIFIKEVIHSWSQQISKNQAGQTAPSFSKHG